MKKIIYVFFALTLGLAAASCSKYDDSELKSKVDKLTEEVNTLKANQKAMQAVIDVWKAGGYVQSIDNSVPGQHTITFFGEDGKTVIIYDGNDGKDGKDGKDGQEGGAFFESVVTTESGVTFTLSDGTSFTIPFAKAFKLVIDNPAREVQDGEVADFPYTVQNANSSTVVDAFANGSYSVTVGSDKVSVTVPTPATPGQVLVWAQNGEGLFSMVKLSFTPGSGGASVTVVSATEDLTTLPAEGGDVVVSLVSNIDIEMEEPAADWVSCVLTKASYALTLTISENPTASPRQTELHILRADNKSVVQTIKLAQLPGSVPGGLTIQRVWGKFSTQDDPWHAYLGDFNSQADRNVAMDAEYIYIAEAKPGVKMIWALDKADGSYATNLPTETVHDAGTFPLCCPRVIHLSDEPVLVVCNMTEAAQAEDFWLYIYENGILAEPTAIQMSGAYDRMGDTFSFWGASATNSADGQGLTKGLLYFDSTNNNGVRIWKTQWTKGKLPTRQWVQSRYGFDNGNRAVGAFWTYPGNKDAGIWGGRGSAEDPTRSAFGSVKAGAPNLWSAEGNQVDNTVCSVIESGYYNNVTAYQFFSFNGMRYIAYAKQVNGADGRLIILEGEPTDEWADIISKREVVYQAAIQEDAEMQEEYNESPMASGHSGMDLCIYPSDEAVDIVVLKQNVGLSLFRMSVVD